MPTYVTLWEFTQQGAQAIKESPARVDHIEEQFAEMEGELREFYMLMGQYDTITISEFPDDETAAQAVLAVTEDGNVSSETFKAFSREEARTLIEDLP
ncbi:GYD domain-containing protein [Halobiforma nitratireducens]|uniref:GYD family protein n=1 Tax=Halobiforma nitratireducens JCM 10879 TaxID=1227454 RepID=M0M7R7_9EURY|nr:GYD domain-containing protein [Halobiforma nitratireducens]EMA41857.1 GYD family protein [Halobiforma nitratireducens JCM 10879]